MPATLTDEIAAAAARLVVDEGMEYAQAKRKALRSLGRSATRSTELPSNELVEAQVREHIALFCADTQPAELRALRRLALVHQRDGLGQDIIVGTLRIGGYRQAGQNETGAKGQQTDAHRILPSLHLRRR